MTKRLFIALEIIPDPNFMTVYSKIKAVATTKLDIINWIKPDLMHITLKFLGDTDPDKISSVLERMEYVGRKTTPFQLDISGIGVFGSRYQPRVLWFGIVGNTAVQQLHFLIQKQMKQLDFKPDFGNFVPHLTIARIHKIEDKRRFRENIESMKTSFVQQITVNKMILYESILKKYTPIYQKMGEVYLLAQ
ncbi:MAG: RNA 2',3'-cyclic phosphodiesterase [Bacteroidales bacterium]|jgi:2'-5' RNA ligase|nr:RNA 2',3'-cyclic phosphodiesterase [Bacteroidales bacterium]